MPLPAPVTTATWPESGLWPVLGVGSAAPGLAELRLGELGLEVGFAEREAVLRIAVILHLNKLGAGLDDSMLAMATLHPYNPAHRERHWPCRASRWCFRFVLGRALMLGRQESQRPIASAMMAYSQEPKEPLE